MSSLLVPDVLNDNTPNHPEDNISPALAEYAKELAFRAGQTMDALINMPTGYQLIPPPTLADSTKAMWKYNLKTLEAECDKADAELAPNRFALRAEFLARKQSYLKTQIEQIKLQEEKSNLKPAFKPLSAAEIVQKYYDGDLSKALKAQTSFKPGPIISSPKEEVELDPNDGFGESSSSVMDEQKFIMRLGILSNGNIAVQTKRLGIKLYGGTTSGTGNAYRLICDHCKATESVEPRVIEGRMVDNPQLINFCAAHRHLTEAPVSVTVEGRKFRDDE